MSRPPVKKFDKEHPCTKVDIFNCFWKAGVFRPRLLVEAEAEIGRNVPYRMVGDGRLLIWYSDNKDWYVLSESGEEWLRTATYRYIKNDPERAAGLTGMPRAWMKEFKRESSLA